VTRETTSPAYHHFKARYFKALLEGQAFVLNALEKILFPVLARSRADYYPTLARMPTGTGKTGVIAVSANFANHGGATLILTPWHALCEQMLSEIGADFWATVALSDKDLKEFVVAPTRIYPSTLARVLREPRHKNRVLVGTLNGLQHIERLHEGTYAKLRDHISLVIVDEGHYEPAVLWGRAVKNLNRPTLMVTATPYRNDLKLFRVPRDRVIHYHHYEAVAAKRFPLREVRAVPLKSPSDSFEAVLEEFVRQWRTKKREGALPDGHPRAIICCENKNRVMEALRFVYKRGLSVMAFHERVESEDFDDMPALKSLFSKQVPHAKTSTEEIWIHQYKLTEGVDDPRFAAILLTYPLGSDRTLVQQVGRILRHSSRAPGKGKQTAYVFHCADYPFDEIWSSYLRFEQEKDLSTGEHYKKVVTDFLALQPEYEFFGRRFRKRLEPFASPTNGQRSSSGSGQRSTTEETKERQREQWRKDAWDAILSPPSVRVLAIHHEFDLRDIVRDITDDLLLHDGVILNADGSDDPLVFEEKGPVLWLYAKVANADILLRRSAYEISIEARCVHRARGYLFVGDTSGVANTDYLARYAHACDYFTLSRCLNDGHVVRQASLFNTQSLNTAVRRTIRQGVNLDDAPYQISERKYVCQNLRAKRLGIVGDRYFGLTSSRISDRVSSRERQRFSLKEFKAWTERLADELVKGGDGRHSFFHRYANVVPNPSSAEPYALILDASPDPASLHERELVERELDESEIAWRVVKTNETVDLTDTVFTIESNTTSEEWPSSLQVELRVGKELARIDVDVRYNRERGEFQFRKGKQTELQVDYRGDLVSLAHFLNLRHDRYAITLRRPGLVYHNHHFFELDYSGAEAKFARHLGAVATLKNTSFEKIPSALTFKAKQALSKWPSQSVFAKVLSDVITVERFGAQIDWLFCDDPRREVADFLVATFSKRKLAFVHCKYGEGKQLSASAFHDLCSQAAKNLVYIRTSRVPPEVASWRRDAVWETTGIPKWIKGSTALPEREDLWQRLRTEILEHPAGVVEVWLVMGNGLRVADLKKMAGSDRQTPEVGPLLHLLDGLLANCAEANVRLRVFGH
jgi:superfamily II DNA or RNA helicase